MKENKKVEFKAVAKKEEKINTISLTALTVEENAIIVNVDGWRRRVYLDLSDKDKEKLKEGTSVNVQYIGSIGEDDFKFLKLKTL